MQKDKKSTHLKINKEQADIVMNFMIELVMKGPEDEKEGLKASTTAALSGAVSALAALKEMHPQIAGELFRDMLLDLSTRGFHIQDLATSEEQNNG